MLAFAVAETAPADYWCVCVRELSMPVAVFSSVSAHGNGTGMTCNHDGLDAAGVLLESGLLASLIP